MTTWKTLQASAADHLTRGDLGKAAHALVEAIELEPSEPRLYEQLIRVTLLGGSTQTAVSAAEELARLSPGPHASHLLAARAWRRGDGEAGARPCLRAGA
jgi:Flp pilus assembly protein TadD